MMRFVRRLLLLLLLLLLFLLEAPPVEVAAVVAMMVVVQCSVVICLFSVLNAFRNRAQTMTVGLFFLNERDLMSERGRPLSRLLGRGRRSVVGAR